jgi:hypothetical protein
MSFIVTRSNAATVQKIVWILRESFRKEARQGRWLVITNTQKIYYFLECVDENPKCPEIKEKCTTVRTFTLTIN